MSVFATIGTESCLQHGFASSDMAEEYTALANEGWHVKDQVCFSPMYYPLQIWPNRCWVMTLKSRFFTASRTGPRKHWSAEGRIIPGGKHCFEAHIASNCSSLICAFLCEMSMALRQSLHQDKPAMCKHCYAHHRAVAFEGGSPREQTRWQRNTSASCHII